MENENFNDLTEQDIVELYDDIIESPMVIAAVRSACGAGYYAYGGGSQCCINGTTWGRVGASYGITSGACMVAY